MFPTGWRQAPPEIETERLRLRCPKEADGPQLYAAISESLAELRPWFAWAVDIELTPANSRFTAAIARERFLSGKEMQFYIFAKGGKNLVGICGLLKPDWAKRTFEICYWLRTCFTGKGYMSEAVLAVTEFAQKRLAAKRVEARCDVANVKGIAVARKAGYILEKKVAGDTRHHLHGQQTEIAVLIAPQP
jgi:RimJ/RimL family protein N-acetyltransferase